VPSSVTLTYDLTTQTTTVTEDTADSWTSPEPDGIVGLCRAGCLYSRCGSSVTYRVRRSRPAVPAEPARAGR
jgi:hypothetical protein